MNQLELLEKELEHVKTERDQYHIKVKELEYEVTQLRGLMSTAVNNVAQGKMKYERALNEVKYYKKMFYEDKDSILMQNLKEAKAEIELYRNRLSNVMQILHEADRAARS